MTGFLFSRNDSQRKNKDWIWSFANNIYLGGEKANIKVDGAMQVGKVRDVLLQKLFLLPILQI